MIHAKNILFRYAGENAFQLQFDDFSVAKGEKVAIIGPSGCGKTTLLDLLCGIKTPDQGEIHFHKQNLSGLGETERRKFRVSRVGLVFQEFELLEYLSVKDNIRLPYLINPSLQSTSEINSRISELAKHVGIEDKLKRLPLRLSQGEKQRVAICRALIHRPEVLLADEPTGNLDPLNKQRILSLLIEQADRDEAALIVVTHDQGLVKQFDRVINVSEFGS